MGPSDDPRQGGKRSISWLPEMDRILIVGMKHGPRGIREATGKVLSLRTGLTRADCWKRLRFLREKANGNGRYPPPRNWPSEIRELLRDGYRQGGHQKREAIKAIRELYPGLPSNAPSRFARRQGWLANAAQASMHRPWTEYENRKLWELAGYETAARIAQRLRRSEEAVRFRLKSLGLSVKVKDGWSFRALQEMLHVGPSKLRRFIAQGLLRVRDPRITSNSLALLLEKRNAGSKASTEQKLTATHLRQLRRDRKAFSWGSAGKTLSIEIDQVRRLIVTGELKIVDGFVTERAFQDFCRRHGSELNALLLGEAVRDWLVEGYSLSPSFSNGLTSASEKHALVVRRCPACRRPMRGNIYFRHVKGCKEMPREPFGVHNERRGILSAIALTSAAPKKP